MGDIVIGLSSFEVSDDGTTWTDLGKIKGGGVFRQTPSEVEIESDQEVDPEAIVTFGFRREIEVNLIDLKPENLALLFGRGSASTTVASDVTSSTSVPVASVNGFQVGDKILVDGTSVTITAIDESTNTLTVDTSVSALTGASVTLDLSGKVVLPNSATEGIIKKVRLTTLPISGYKFQITLDRARLKPEGEVSLNNEGNAIVKLSVVNLASTTAPKIEKIAA